jgi:hypothetical protein
MDWPQVLTFLGGIITIVAALIGVCAWFYKMTREQILAIKEDVRAIDRKSEESSKEIRGLIESIREDGRIFREKWVEESRSFNEKWAAESREYHGRLCAIEERRAGRPRKEDRA